MATGIVDYDLCTYYDLVLGPLRFLRRQRRRRRRHGLTAPIRLLSIIPHTHRASPCLGTLGAFTRRRVLCPLVHSSGPSSSASDHEDLGERPGANLIRSSPPAATATATITASSSYF